jgi:uncharacterized low-complexity protein
MTEQEQAPMTSPDAATADRESSAAYDDVRNPQAAPGPCGHCGNPRRLTAGEAGCGSPGDHARIEHPKSPTRRNDDDRLN